jgi:hypothetical protein
LRSSQSTIGATRRVLRQLDRALQEGGRRREPATRCSPVGGLLELRRDDLVGFHCGGREMPCTTIGIDLCVGGRRQRRVSCSSIVGICRPVHGRPHERVAERHAGAHRQQTVGSACQDRCRRHAEPRSCSPYQGRVADRLGRRDQQ